MISSTHLINYPNFYDILFKLNLIFVQTKSHNNSKKYYFMLVIFIINHLHRYNPPSPLHVFQSPSEHFAGGMISMIVFLIIKNFKLSGITIEWVWKFLKRYYYNKSIDKLSNSKFLGNNPYINYGNFIRILFLKYFEYLKKVDILKLKQNYLSR